MKLSFVIPAYNEQDYIHQCLNAIIAEIARTSYEVEIIVVNNASTDATGSIAASFPGVIVVDEPQKGLVAARAAGLRRASGDLIANVDADTRVPSGWLTTVFQAFAADQNLVALSGPMIYYDVSPANNLARRAFYGLVFLLYIVNKHVFKVCSVVQGGNFVVRRTALSTIGGYNTDYTFYGEDADLARRLFAIGEVTFTFKLPMFTSGRRILVEGPLTTAYHYALNYFSTLWLKRPVTASERDIRSEEVKIAANSDTDMLSSSKRVLLVAGIAVLIAGLGFLMGQQELPSSTPIRQKIVEVKQRFARADVETDISETVQVWYNYFKELKYNESSTN